VRAYVDESVREAPSGHYLLAAMLVPDDRADEVREVLRASVRRGSWRFHWHDESPTRRAEMAVRVAALGLDAVVVCTEFTEPRGVERARARCLVRLLWELDERGVSDVVLERRQPGNDRDHRTIAGMRRSGWAATDLLYEFSAPRQECLLWLPDVVAGATVPAVADGDASYLALLGARVCVVEVT
jgi:hypothetical protein